MALKILEAATAGLDHPAFKGVPRTSGVDPGNVGETAMKLLMFVDGESSLKDLAEVLSIDAGSVVKTIVALSNAGVIGFDSEWTDAWLSDATEPTLESHPAVRTAPDAVEAPSTRAADPEPGEKLRVMTSVPPRPTVFPEAPRMSVAMQSPGTVDGQAGGESEDIAEEAAGEVIEEGRLDETPAWQVITRLARTDFTGRLRFSTPQGRRDIHVLGGKPVFAVSDHSEEDLGTMLRSRDRITEQDYQSYIEAKDTASVDPSRLLVRLEIVPEYNRLRALRWQVQTILFASLEDATGTFLVEQFEQLPPVFPKFDLNFSRILTRFLDEKLPVDEQIDQLEQKMEFFLAVTPGVAEQSFQEKEQRLWEIVMERPRKLKDVLSLSTMFRRETFKFVLLLLVNGLVELKRHVKVVEGPVELADLPGVVEDLEESNYFDVLGLHAVSSISDIDSHYSRLMKKFDESEYTHLDDSHREMLGKCRKRIAEARVVMLDERKRAEHRQQVFSPYQLAQFAQLQYQKGEIYLWWRNDAPESFPFFRSAFELDPSQPLYWGAYAISVVGGGSSDPGIRRQAIKLAERIAALKSPDPVALVMAGGALLKSGQASRGQECLDRAMKLSGGTVAIQKMIKVAQRI